MQPAYAVEFPGRVEVAPSPSSAFELTYTDPGANEDGIHVYTLKLVSRRNTYSKTLLTFTRSVDVSWSPEGAWFYVNNFIGSNVSDCVIGNAEDASFGTVSVTAAVFDAHSRPAGVPPPPETPANSHFNLSCKIWGSNKDLFFDLVGMTDAGGSFSYKYRIGLLDRRIQPVN